MSPRCLPASMQLLRAYERRRLLSVDDAPQAVPKVPDDVAAGACDSPRLARGLET